MGTINHYVTFYSPGTLFSEQTTKQIAEWDTHRAVQMAAGTSERYGAKPYGFAFFTLEEHEPIEQGGKTFTAEPNEKARSPFHHIGGEVLTLEAIKARGDESDRILIANMESHKWPAVVETRHSFRHVYQLERDHVLVDTDGTVVGRGADHYPAEVPA